MPKGTIKISRGRRHCDRYSTKKLTADFIALCHDPLPDLRRWMDADRKGGRTGHHMPARPRARVAGHDRMRSVRGEGRAAGRRDEAAHRNAALRTAWRGRQVVLFRHRSPAAQRTPAASNVAVQRENDLSAYLDAVALDVQREAGAVTDSIRAAFAIQMEEVVRRGPGHAIGGALAALRAAQRAALAAVAQKTASAIRGRRQAVKQRRPIAQQMGQPPQL